MITTDDQTTNQLLMIRPVRFEFNAQTAVNNSFQSAGTDAATAQKAQLEFDAFAKLLQNNGIEVTIINDTAEPHTPDSVFPNNWISFHQSGTVITYPMFAENRRTERKPHVLKQLEEKFLIREKIDFSHYEDQHIFLEGTGSMVLDRKNRITYACLSPRTHKRALEDFCMRMNYSPVEFTAVDQQQQPIYHTNVMMCVADKYAVICLESIPDPAERNMVEARLTETNKEIIPISLSQMNQFAGNMLQVSNKDKQAFLIMSSQAWRSLKPEQIHTLQKYNPILHSPLDTIETNGGGSARCMMAEIFLEKRGEN